MRYIIYGAGGIGGAIGGRLLQRGHEVVLICRGEQLTAIQRRGLTLKTPTDTLQLPIRAIGHPLGLSFTDSDVVILTMKSQDTELALRDLERAGGGGVPVVCCQNGVDNERMAARRFARVYGMVVWVPATYLEPGVVLNHATPVGGILDAGCYPRGVDPLITQVTADLTAGGFGARPDLHIMRWKYTKLLSNLYNALQAVCGLEARGGDFARAVRQEALACYRAAGIDFVPEDEMRQRVQAEVKLAAIADHPRTGGSTWQSLTRGLSSIEVDFLNGEIVLLGKLHGVPTPHNRLLQTVANHMARTGQRPGSMSVAELQGMLNEGQARRI
ncbi:MAG TPA: 2-dehydropantoate 2-reductase N-terminal domain-containing protein [Candidatus Binatia bacterium]|jgi:2-dehydropantoate 2-reductase|nr:2-dehydropantoate 2-reductase N-terminal domain-containing protein [Candidatus Binatia bacterium]